MPCRHQPTPKHKLANGHTPSKCRGTCKVGDTVVEQELIYEKLPGDIAKRHVLLMDPILATGNSAARAIQVSPSRPCWLGCVFPFVVGPHSFHRLCVSTAVLLTCMASLPIVDVVHHVRALTASLAQILGNRYVCLSLKFYPCASWHETQLTNKLSMCYT